MLFILSKPKGINFLWVWQIIYFETVKENVGQKIDALLLPGPLHKDLDILIIVKNIMILQRKVYIIKKSIVVEKTVIVWKDWKFSTMWVFLKSGLQSVVNELHS